MWQKNGAKDLAPQSDRTSARPATQRGEGRHVAGWLASSWMSIKVNAALYSQHLGIWLSESVSGNWCELHSEYISGRKRSGAESAAVAVVLLTPPGVFPALVLTNLLSIFPYFLWASSGGGNKQQQLFGNCYSCKIYTLISLNKEELVRNIKTDPLTFDPFWTFLIV